MLWNTLMLALRAIRRNLMRSFLTVLGVVIGVAAVITMVTLGNGATRSVSDQIASMGSNLLLLIPGQRFGRAPRRLRGSRARTSRHPQPDLRRPPGRPVVGKTTTAVYQANNWSTVVNGAATTTSRRATGSLRRSPLQRDRGAGGKGRVRDRRERAREAVRQQNPVGSEIRIKQFACEVIGLLKAKGQSAMARTRTTPS